MIELETPISKLPAATDARVRALARLGIKTVRDLLFHFPRRYDDFTNAKKIVDLEEGETATVRGKILSVKNIRTWKKKINITEAVISDESGEIRAVWFNQPFLTNVLKAGESVYLSGKTAARAAGRPSSGRVSLSVVGRKAAFEIYLSNPAHEKAAEENELKHTGRLVPVYPETAGVSSRWLRWKIKPLLPLVKNLADYLPPDLKTRKNLPNLNEAILNVHFPSSAADAEAARRRFAFEELFLLQLAAKKARENLRKENAPAVRLDLEAIKKFVAALPFSLTDAQRRAAWEILQDLAKNEPMNRLLNGDVGSGKTVVACLAAFDCALDGRQTAFMAPTEILALQHFDGISKLLKNHEKIKIGLFTGKTAKIGEEKAKKNDLLEKISEGKIHVLIGTHSLIQKNVRFKNLALAVVDEQHRFGVAQRAALLSDKAAGAPHFLSMTATPIPRTLALTVFGDLDISILNEMPKGRQAVTTKIVPPSDRSAAYDFIRAEIAKGRQAFVICPRIELAADSQQSATGQNFRKLAWADAKAVKEEHKKLSEKIFPDLKIAALHGKMKVEEKAKILADFKNKKSDVLVATSVVEVGIDVPNATVMMIEGADKFGLAQLHQFRGRVGRGEHRSFCLLFSDSLSGETNRRLKALVDCRDGFKLAERDLEIRGPGDFIGGRQWGIPDLAMASLSDANLIKEAREEATAILKDDPELARHPLLAKKLDLFAKSAHLE